MRLILVVIIELIYTLLWFLCDKIIPSVGAHPYHLIFIAFITGAIVFGPKESK